MTDCLTGGPIDQQLPFGNDLVRIFSVNGPNALEDVPTFGQPKGSHLEFLHADTDATISYVLKPGVAPAGPTGYYVQPNDYNGATNNFHWALAKIAQDGAVGIFNPDINGGLEGGGWNLPLASGDVNPQLDLSDDPGRIINAADLT